MNPAEKQLFAEGFADSLIKTVEQTRDRANVVNSIFSSKDIRKRIRFAWVRSAFRISSLPPHRSWHRLSQAWRCRATRRPRGS